ncbi:discoidin domain-containing protein [Luteimonas galliterrae]|uniref:discoidin domain-containing protein n=1 Tax=Luteimonas galliterrae TaxID=2940486 RepID=UPI003CE58D62
MCFCLALLYASSTHAQPASRLLDAFENPSDWKVVVSNQVSGKLRQIQGVDGKALCLDYDFSGVSGYAGIQRDIAIDYPQNYQFTFQLRGDSPKNDLQFKLIDASGDNVWWVNRPKYDYPRDWAQVRYKKRHIDKAWGPDPDRTLRRSAKLEYTIYNNEGGKGSVCFDELAFAPLPPDDRSPLKTTAMATAANGGAVAGRAADGDPGTAWYADFAAEPSPQLTLDLGKRREFGGLVLEWQPKEYATDYLVQLSDDGKQWRDVRTVIGGDGGTDYLALPESEARYIKLLAGDGPQNSFGLSEATVQPLEFAATPNDFVRSVAKDSPRGWYPRGFIGEQPYWTILGIDGGEEQGLIGEDGAIEVAKSGFSIEPFVMVDGEVATWADVGLSQSLQDGYLPIPSVEWKHDLFGLRVTAFAQGERMRSQLVARYRLTNASDAARDYVLALAVQPFQVNPPTQFLSTVGGVSAIGRLSVDGGTASIADKARVFADHAPDASFASTFDAGMAISHLFAGALPEPRSVDDPTGLASGAMLYRMRLMPGESHEVALMIPMNGPGTVAAKPWDAERLQQAVAADWRGKLDRVHISVPKQGQALVDTLRTATAHMLVSRIGPRLQPGTRSYARSWIRDGAMISEGLLRMGREDAVKDYVAWYAPYQFKDGMVPCCVDRRGSDPVPENDSHGELIFNIAELYRYDGDRAFLAKMWPHVLGAFQYMEKLRLSERTEANRAKNRAFYGMMPVSISHEGYSAKPVHSYWDNFWALRGYKDAVEVAQWLGKTQDAERFAAARDQFRDDLYASLQAAAAFHKIDYLPGSAELGDFDATSTTIALAPGGEQGRLPKRLLDNTFERYWREFEQRRDGEREWEAYTPYEWRNVAAFVRLGWRERAWSAVDFFFADREPAAWNQWAEVVARERRKPFFVGDLPHAWVASDFVRSALDMFAYVREIDDSIVLAAGIPAAWLDGEGVAIRDLRTANGKLAYSLRREGGTLRLDIPKGPALPKGGLVLPWPYKTAPGSATINGRPAQWHHGELRIASLPAKVEIAAP